MRRTRSNFCLLFIMILVIPGISRAQKLAVEGKTPANPTLIASIPDTKAFWKELNSSLFGKAVVSFIGQTLPLSPENQERLDQVQSRIGMEFYPADKLLTETLSGLDLYMVEHPEYSNFLVNIAFNNPDAGNLILTQIKREAAYAYGISGGISADTVVESTTEGYRTISLPAFSLFMAADQNVLTFSNDKKTLDSALVNKGKALFVSQYFNKYMLPLEGTKGEFWCFGEPAEFIPVIEQLSEEGSETQIPSLSPLGGVIDFHANGLSASIFQNQEGMSPAQRRYTLSSPPPGDVTVFNFYSQDSVFSFGTNHFDGLSILDLIIEEADKSSSGTMNENKIQQYLDQSRLLLGFDLKNDLLANIGPSLGVSLAGVEQVNLMGMMIPLPDFLLSIEVKDKEKFLPIMEMLEKMLEEALMPTGAQAPPVNETVANEENPVPTASTQSSPLRKEMYAGEEVVYFELEGQKASSPAICLTKTGFFLFSTSKEQLVQALDVYNGGGAPLVDSAPYQRVKSQLPENLNTLSVIDLQGISEVLNSFMPLMLKEENAEQLEFYQGIIAMLQRGEMIATSTQHLQSGRRIDLEVHSK